MNDSIEKDDEKMDELMFLQTVSEGEPKYSSIEEKYEDEILFEKIASIMREYRNKEPIFFNKDEDEE